MSAIAVQREVPAASDSTERVIAWVGAERNIADYVRQPFLRLARASLLFWAGDQYVDFISGLDQKWERRSVRPAGLYSVRKTDNQLVQLCRDAIQRAAQNMPQMRVDPNSSGPEPKMRAAFATKLLRYIEDRRVVNEERQRERELMWLVGVGECLRGTQIDTEGGDPGNPQGELKGDVLSPFCYMKDPYSTEHWPPRFLITERAYHVDWIKSRYGVEVKPQGLNYALQYLDEISGAVISNSYTAKGQRQEMRGAALVTELTVPPSRAHPRGHVWVVSGDKLLDAHELQFGIFPYSLCNWYELPGRYQAMSLIEMVLNKQMELNHLVSLLFEAAIVGVRGDIITSGYDGKIETKEIDPETGRTQTQLPPETTVQQRVLAADWQQAETRRIVIVKGMKEDAGTSESTLGQSTNKTQTAYEIQKQRESNQGGLSYHVGRYASQHLTRVAMTALELYQRFVVAPRVAKVRQGPGVEPEALVFVGADLKGAGDVVAVPIPYLSPGVKQEARFQAYQTKMYGPFATPEDEWAARKAFMRMGLWEDEGDIADTSVPLEQLEQEVREIRRMRRLEALTASRANIAAATAAAEQASQAVAPQDEQMDPRVAALQAAAQGPQEQAGAAGG